MNELNQLNEHNTYNKHILSDIQFKVNVLPEFRRSFVFVF